MQEFKPDNFKPREKSILDDMENQLILARNLEGVYKKRPDPREFIGAMAGTKFEGEYTKEAIEEDEKYVIEKRKKIEEKNSSYGQQNLESLEGGFALSEMLQAMVVDRLNKDWLEEFKAIMTSDLDDLRVGADAILKSKDGRYLAASFDFTITNKEKFIYNKLSDTWDNNVVKGNIPTIKYYEDPDTHVKSKIIAPKFIICATKQDVEEMAKAYIENRQDDLKNHKFQYMIIEQMYEQLVSIRNFLDNHPDDTQLDFSRKHYSAIYDTVQRIRDKFQREDKINNVEFYEYSKQSPGLAMMRTFKISKEKA